MRIVGHSDQALAIALLSTLVARYALLGDVALCAPVPDLTLIYLTLVEAFACIVVWLVALKFDGTLYSFHYLGAQLLLLLLLHPFPFHQHWAFLPLWLSAVLVYGAWAFYIDCIPLFYRTLDTPEFTYDMYLGILNTANAICINDVNVRTVAAVHPSVRALQAFEVQRDAYDQPRLVATPITSMTRPAGSGGASPSSDYQAAMRASDGGEAAVMGTARRRRSSFSEDDG